MGIMMKLVTAGNAWKLSSRLRVGAGAGLQLRRGAQVDDAPVVDDGDAMGHAFGLVQEQDPRGVQERARNLQPALHAAGEGLRLLAAAVPQLEFPQQRLVATAPLPSRHGVQRGVQFHVLLRGQHAVEAGILEHDAEAPARLVRMGGHVQPVDADAAAGGLQQRGQHLDGGGLAGAVGPQEGEYLAASHREIEAAHGLEGAEGAHQPLDIDHAFHAIPRQDMPRCPRSSS
jgi:hypothetical protein